MRRHGRKGIMVLAAAVLAATLSGCGKKYEEAAVTTAAETEAEPTRVVVLETEPETEPPETEPEELVERVEVDGKIRSYLTGEMVDVAIGNRRPLAVMMSNDKESLPQYGINRAGVVYEAPVEGTMNRYMSLIEDYDDLGRYYLEELEVSKVPAHLQNYIDYEAYGRDVALEENGTFTDQGYVWDTREAFHEYYDGERGSIPDEYRVMTFQDDLPEEEKSEWAMDIAFDMDEFFRQNDPQYAAEHPEAHAAKEELYENLMAGRISSLDEKLAALGQTQEDYLPSEIEKFKDATGYEEFLDFDPAEVKAALDDPEKSHADEMLSAAEKVASEKMTVLVVEPMKEPYVKEIDPDLHSLQAEVGGDIGATYPYSDPVALVCNDEGKLIGLDLNRGLRDENGEIYDIVAGTFLVVGLGEEDFASLSPELIQKYTEQFKTPERFMQINGNIVVLPVPAEKQDLTYLPDRFETGERVQTPRGSFQVTAMSREQMEAAGYGVHHISDDGKYLIMGNGTRAFAVAAEQPEKDNPLRTVEMTLEDDYGMIDGVINNGRRGEELEKAQEYAERITPEKPSIRERLEDAKRECAEHKPPEGKKPGRDVPEHDCL